MCIQRVSDNVSMVDSPFNGSTGVLGTYIVQGDHTLVMDPGPATQTTGVLAALKKQGVANVGIIALTHIHLDHAAGCWKMLEEYPDAVVHCHPRGVQHMVDPSKIKAAAIQQFRGELPPYGEIKGLPEEKVKASTDGEVIDLGGVRLQVIWTPGHSTHSHAYYEPEEKVLFVGDTVGHTHGRPDHVIPASPPPFNPVQTVESITKLIALDPKVLCISHFGFHENAVARLRSFEEQVLLWEKLVFKGVEEQLDLTGVFNLVKEHDPVVQAMLEANPASKGDVFSSLVGFVGYAKWVKKNN
ncbi:MAG: MBL fold metallo-hydrolase [Candidatus Bathyarchaeota archaeon]|nr:MBL fold metallo-hydrolase [Candidatus Bathyarchaeota archaeon]